MGRRGTLLIALATAVGLFAVAAGTLGVLVVAGLGGALGGGCGGDGGPGGGTQQIGPRTFSAEQMTNAQTIVALAVDRALPKRAAVIALSTAIVESGLENLDYGDRDSLGLFQQRPSQGWGSPEQLLNPAYAAAQFYDNLLELSGWATMPPGAAAQAVQRSAFPDRYAPQEAPAAGLVERLWVGPDNSVPATPGPTGEPGAMQVAGPVDGAVPGPGGLGHPAQP